MGKGSRRASFVGRLSLSRRVLYQWFHCTLYLYLYPPPSPSLLPPAIAYLHNSQGLAHNILSSHAVYLTHKGTGKV